MVHAVLVGGALVFGAAAAQAQSADQLTYGQGTQFPATTMYSAAYGQQVLPAQAVQAINPGTSYGLNSTVAGLAGATVGGTTVNTSAIGGGAPLQTGRAATTVSPLPQ